MRAALGVDPGLRGGAALLSADGRTVLVGWSWESRDGLVDVRQRGREPGGWSVHSLHLVAVHIARVVVDVEPDEGVAVAVERLFVGKGMQSTIALIEATGEILGPLRCLARRSEVVRPLANGGWREALLGKLPRSYLQPGPRGGKPSRSEAWARRAVDLAPAAFDLDGLGDLRRNEHAVEACWIARAAQVAGRR